MGWGRTNNKRNDAGDRFSGGAHSNVLQKLKVPFIANDFCRSNYTAFQNITSNKQICAGGMQGIKIFVQLICLLIYIYKLPEIHTIKYTKQSFSAINFRTRFMPG